MDPQSSFKPFVHTNSKNLTYSNKNLNEIRFLFFFLSNDKKTKAPETKQLQKKQSNQARKKMLINKHQQRQPKKISSYPLQHL